MCYIMHYLTTPKCDSENSEGLLCVGPRIRFILILKTEKVLFFVPQCVGHRLLFSAKHRVDQNLYRT